jgi:hypothetical protein
MTLPLERVASRAGVQTVAGDYGGRERVVATAEAV